MRLTDAKSVRDALRISASHWAFVGSLTLLSGCASSSISSDMSRVRDLTSSPAVAHVEDADVDPATSEEIERTLKKPLDADGAVRIALANNRELRATLRELGVPRGRWIQAGLLPNPRAELEVLPEKNSLFELRLEYDITHALLAPLRGNAAEPALDAARHRAAAAVVALGYHVRVAFYRLQSTEERLALAQRALDAFAASRDAARALSSAGNLRELDLASQEVAYERARIAVAELELAASKDREALSRLLGLHGEALGFEVRGTLPTVPVEAEVLDDVETRALRASHELRETKSRLEGLSRQTGVSRASGWLPDIAVDVHALTKDPDAPPGSEDDEWRFGAGVSATLPIFDRNQGTTTALEAEFDALRERYYGQAIDVRSAAREARNRIASARARATQYQDVIAPAQAKVTEQTLLQYNAMQIGVFQLLEARREGLAAQMARVDTLREYWSARAELGALLAGARVEGDMPAATVMSNSAETTAGGH